VAISSAPTKRVFTCTHTATATATLTPPESTLPGGTDSGWRVHQQLTSDRLAYNYNKAGAERWLSWWWIVTWQRRGDVGGVLQSKYLLNMW